MNHRHQLDCVERTFKDMLAKCLTPVDPTVLELPFAGKVVVLGGDFRQMLPVVRRGNRSQCIGASIKYSPTWASVQQLPLHTNMRIRHKIQLCDQCSPLMLLHNTPLEQCCPSCLPKAREQLWFEQFLLQIGSGTHPSSPNHEVTLPPNICMPADSSLQVGACLH